jgi:UDP-glucuronate decarboxylase
LEIKVARIFNTYGPNMDINDGRVVSNFIIQALQGQPLTIYGDGTQTRSFCFVDDMIRGLIALMESPGEITGPINLGNPKELTIGDLAEAVLRLTKSSSELEFHPLPDDDPFQRQPDISLAKNQLAWQPSIDLEEGLIQTIDYFQSLLSTKPSPK